MAEVTVGLLAEMVGVTVERLLDQMNEAGLSQTKPSEEVTEYDRQVLLSHLKRSHGEEDNGPEVVIKSSIAPSKTAAKQHNKHARIKKERKKLIPLKRFVYKKQTNDKLQSQKESHVSKQSESADEDGKRFSTASPKVFLSYSYDSKEHEQWVEQLGLMLRSDGIDVALDKWDLHLGDPITEYMESAIRNSDFVLIICTEKYKRKSDERLGGVGYEEAIISSDIFSNAINRKYIPILKSPDSRTAIPTALHSKKYLDLSDDEEFNRSYQYLLLTLLGRVPKPPPIGEIPENIFS